MNRLRTSCDDSGWSSHGDAGLYNLRVGDYRVLYEILHGEQTIVIHAIGHRRDIYRKR